MTSTKSNPSLLIDESVLDELKSIMDDEFTDVLQVFLDESVSLMSEIHQAFEEESELESLIRAVHAFKSCSKNVGAIRLGDIAEEVRAFLADDDVDSAKKRLDELQEVFTQSHARIKKCLQDNMDKVA